MKNGVKKIQAAGYNGTRTVVNLIAARVNPNQGLKSRVFLQCQLCIVNYYVKSSSKNIINENIKIGVDISKIKSQNCKGKTRSVLQSITDSIIAL